WQTGRAASRARRERNRLAWQAYGEQWQARWQSGLTEPPRRLVAYARRQSDQGLKWTRANGRALASNGVAALVVAGVMMWTAVSWRTETRSEAPAQAVRDVAARDVVSGGELGSIELANPMPTAAPPRPVESKTDRAANPVRSRPLPVVTAANDRSHSEQLDATRPQAEVATTAETPPPLDSPQRPSEVAEVAPRVAQLSSQQITRIQNQAEQKLRQRGLLRVSPADRWGITLETGSSGEVSLAGVLRDMALYNEAVRLVREVPDVRAVRGSVDVWDVGSVSIVQSDAARIQAEVQKNLRTRGLLRESTADRWGVTVEVNPEGEVMLEGAVRDTQMYSETVRRAQEAARGRHVKQDIKVMERSIAQ
ncbi:MAG: BON domain-containing protein, partial [Candidatus Rokuibacteriota bacterium]